MMLEKTWLLATGGVLLIGMALMALGQRETGTWLLVAGIALGFLPLLLGLGWLLWEKLSRRKTA